MVRYSPVTHSKTFRERSPWDLDFTLIVISRRLCFSVYDTYVSSAYTAPWRFLHSLTDQVAPWTVTSTGKPDMLGTITQLRRRVRNKEKTRLRQLKAVCKSLDPGATGMISERSVLHRSTFPYVPRCALPLCRPRQYKAFWAQLCATSGAGKSGATHKQFLDFTMSPSLFVNSKCGGPSCRVVILCPYTPSVVSSSSQSSPIYCICV